jgi:poly(A) polymerase
MDAMDDIDDDRMERAAEDASEPHETHNTDPLPDIPGMDELADMTLRVRAIVSPAFAVGGCLRDTLLGRPVHDWDFSTPLDPEQTEQAVRAAGRHPYLAGKRFGTVGFRIPGDDPSVPFRYVEVTSFRAETYEPDSRKPHVEYVSSLVADLSRRDFTINAMAFDGERLHDPFGGRADLNAKLIRAVGDPAERLSEDPLRLMRAARFAAQLGFEIDDRLTCAMREVHARLTAVSNERMAVEMDKLLVAPQPGLGLEALLDSGALRFVVPEVAALAQADHGWWEELLGDVSRSPADEEHRWAALLRTTGRATGADDDEEVAAISAIIARRTGLGLHWSKKHMQAVCTLIDNRQ